MVTQEHLQTARDFLADSDREFAAGESLQGSEKLWGAAAHAVMAAAQQRGWPCGKHGNLKTAAGRLAEETGDSLFREGFTNAEKFHANFYHDFMEDFQLAADRPVVHDFVTRLLALIEAAGDTPRN